MKLPIKVAHRQKLSTPQQSPVLENAIWVKNAQRAWGFLHKNADKWLVLPDYLSDGLNNDVDTENTSP